MLPIKKSKKTLPDDLVANHPDKFTVRAIWSAVTGKNIPEGFLGVVVKHEKDRITKYILVPVADLADFAFCTILDPARYKEWPRK